YGFAGLRDDDDRLCFDPRLPEAWRSISFSLAWHGMRIAIRLDKTSITFTLDGAYSRPLWVRGEQVDLIPGESVVVELADQGPVREGRPSLDRVFEVQSEAGVDVPRKAW
ncbi:MAG: glycosyl hydrolase family 65 protein, partial [Glutamicibacter arilaitensis]